MIAPVTLVAGSNGNTMAVTITNNTVYAGTSNKAPYTFKVHGVLVAYGAKVVDANRSVALGPGEVKTISWTFGVPAIFFNSNQYAAVAWLMTTDDVTPIGTQILSQGSITPVAPTNHYVETYRGYEIWQDATGFYYCGVLVNGSLSGAMATVAAVEAWIDAQLYVPPPPEEPPPPPPPPVTYIYYVTFTDGSAGWFGQDFVDAVMIYGYDQFGVVSIDGPYPG